MSVAFRLSREDGADMNFAHMAKLSGAISILEFMEWVEKIIAQSESPLPDYIYDLAFLSPESMTVSDLHRIIPNISGSLTDDEDKVLMAISVIRDQSIINRSDEKRPSTPEAAKKILNKFPEATGRFETFFPGLLP